ncbi:MAG: cyclic nucleotide-binding domain-containing protein [Nitrospinae bacterium]|nr:cyclic nucleotide-binding domain-containing protein [Nitrospinota bacterium]MBL7019465.1 cyclic nucleotide-binding domain-containing protein [Nitrospinaceae bacterium]
MNILKDLEALKKVPICLFFQEAELKCVYSSGRMMHLKKDQVLFSEHAVQETLYIILSGSMEVYKKQNRIAVRGAGDFVGEMALLESKPRSASVRALTDADVLEIDKETFFAYFVPNPKVIWEILKVISARNREDLDVIVASYQEIRNSREKYRRVVDSSSDIIIQTDADGKIVFANKAVSFLGYDVFDLIGQNFISFCEDNFSDTSRAHVLTRRVGPRTTTDYEISLTVNQQSTLYDLCRCIDFMVTATGMWSVPQELVMKKGTQKEFQGTLLVIRKEKQGSYRLV